MSELLLVVDVGNSHTVLGLYHEDTLTEHWRIATDAKTTTDELGVLLLSLFSAHGISAKDVSAVVCASVVPPLMHATRRVFRRYFDVDPVFVSADTDLGMPIHCDNPQEVGADRLVNAFAAYARYGTAAVVVDFGTATTFDVVSEAGAYEGGVIAPGLGTSLDALFVRAAKLPRVEIAKPKAAIGKNTVSSMQSGIVYGYVGLVDGLVTRVLGEIETKGPVTVVATGGLAGLIAAESATIAHVEPFLTLDGLRLIYLRSRCDRRD